MLNLIFGNPGSGKTTKIIDGIRRSVAEGRRTYLLVPEQQVYISECMLSDLDGSAALYFEVVSFSRLADIVFGRYGGLCSTHLSSGIRNLLMWQNLRSLDGLLLGYKLARSDKALASMMLSTVDELSANSISPDMLEDAASKCESEALRNKLYDLSLIYAGFESSLLLRIGEGAVRSEKKLRRLAEVLRSHDFFAECDIYIDSFTDFTGEEHEALCEIMTQAHSTTIALCYGGRGCHTIYSSTVSDTLRALTRSARDRNIEISEIVLKENYRARSVELYTLQGGLWDLGLTTSTIPQIPEDERGCIEQVICKNEYEEAECAALKILAEHKRGVKFSEIAVVIRDAETRVGIINTVFEKYGIPYFYSEKTDLSSSAACRLILSALRIVASDFRTRDVLTILKTGLCGIPLSDIDLFEEYCLTWNISGKTFFESAWSMNPDGFTIQRSERAENILSSANRVRSTLIPPLERLSEKLSASNGDVPQMCLSLYEYLCEINLSASISEQAEFALCAGDIRGAGELLRLYDFIIAALGNVSNTLSDAKMSVDELIVALEILFSGSDIASVPSVSDYVTVGSASTLRVENIRVAILLGLSDGEFPGNFSQSGLLSEIEKADMSSLGIKLKSREEKLVSDELFFVWRSMTLPSERLILISPSSSVSGGAKAPSSAFNRVSFLFPYIEKEHFNSERIRNFLSKNLLENKNDVKQDTSGESIHTEHIDANFVRMLFGDELMLTKSKINTFVGCPYSFWAQYVLSLREKKISKLSYADSGSFIHFIFEKFLSAAIDENGRIRELEEAEALSLADEISMQYIRSTEASLNASTMYSLTRLRNLSLVMLRSVTEELISSPFHIVGFEQRISDHGNNSLSPMKLNVFEDDDGTPTVSLGGTVDRIDAFESDGKTYLRIIDYKTGNKEFDLSKFSSGEDIQLPAYLFTVASEKNKEIFSPNSELIPASALYLSAGEKDGRAVPLRSGFILSEEEMLAASRPAIESGMISGATVKKDGSISGRAILSAEEIDEIGASLRNSVCTVARQLYSGMIAIKPSEDACRFCSLRTTCSKAIKSK